MFLYLGGRVRFGEFRWSESKVQAEFDSQSVPADSVQCGFDNVRREAGQAVCDYLTDGVDIRRRWSGLLGIGGLRPRGGGCAGAALLSALKVFMS